MVCRSDRCRIFGAGVVGPVPVGAGGGFGPGSPGPEMRCRPAVDSMRKCKLLVSGLALTEPAALDPAAKGSDIQGEASPAGSGDAPREASPKEKYLAICFDAYFAF